MGGFNILTRSQVLPWSVTGSLISISYALLGIAGSFNPAVTLGVILSGPDAWGDHWLAGDEAGKDWNLNNHIAMMIMQILGGICGGLTSGFFMTARDDLPRWVQVELGEFATAVRSP